VPSSRSVAVVVTLLALLAGCAESTQGSPSPGGEPDSTGTSSTPSTSSAGTSTSEPDGGDGLAAIEPCGILDQSDLGAMQLTGGNEVKLGSARTCDYRREGATLNESFTVSLALWDNQGLDKLNAPTKQQLPDIGSHKAFSFVDAGGVCGTAIGVGDSSRVDSSATGGDEQQACQLAAQLATIVERKLP
jgi:uncharacterized protein DUF3558